MVFKLWRYQRTGSTHSAIKRHSLTEKQSLDWEAKLISLRSERQGAQKYEVLDRAHIVPERSSLRSGTRWKWNYANHNRAEVFMRAIRKAGDTGPQRQSHEHDNPVSPHFWEKTYKSYFQPSFFYYFYYYCHVYGVHVTIMTSSGSDDWTYWHFGYKFS
jgi:hypothetical protein